MVYQLFVDSLSAMNKFEAIKAFCALCHQGSFVGAAQVLNTSSTMISRYVKHLEKELGCLLVKRNTRQVHITQAGRHYLASIEPLLASFEQVHHQMQQYNDVPQGKLTISSSIEFGGQYLAPVIAQYTKNYPEVDVDVRLSNQPVDIWHDDIDVALRVAPSLPEASFIAQPICHSRLALWASPSYLSAHGKPRKLADLKQYRLLFFSHSVRSNSWIVETDGKQQEITFNWAWQSNNGRLLNEAAALGDGIIQAPSYSVADYVKRGELVELMPELSLDKLAISAVYPHSYEYSISIKALVMELKNYFSLHPIA